jgi:hypothetical protein
LPWYFSKIALIDSASSEPAPGRKRRTAGHIAHTP